LAIGEETMHTSFFKSIAGSLAALALGVSVATTPALAHGGGGGFHGGFGGGGFHGGFGGGGFRGGFGDRGFRGGFGGYYGGYGYCGYGYGYYGYYGYGNCFAY
jgi:hypothetical protein